MITYRFTNSDQSIDVQYLTDSFDGHNKFVITEKRGIDEAEIIFGFQFKSGVDYWIHEFAQFAIDKELNLDAYDNNEYLGRIVEGGVLEPCLKNLSFWQGLNLYDTNEVENKVEGGTNITISQANCVQLNASTSYIKLCDNANLTDVTLTVNIKTTDNKYVFFNDANNQGNGYVLIGEQGSAQSGGWLEINPSKPDLLKIDNTIITESTTRDTIYNLLSDGLWHTVTIHFPTLTNVTLLIGGYAGFELTADVYETKSDKLGWHTYSEGIGNIFYDKYKINNAIGNNISHIKQDVSFSNHMYGFDLWENETGDFLRVPFDYEGNSIKTKGDIISGFTFIANCPAQSNVWNRSESKFDLPQEGVKSVEELFVSSNLGTTLFFEKRYDINTQQALNSAPVLINGNYEYDGGVIVRGSNYFKFEKANSDFVLLKDKYLEDGDVIAFWAKNDNPADEGNILGSSASKQIKLLGSTNQMFMLVSDNALYYNTGVNVSEWNYYKIHIESDRIGLSVNNLTIDWKATTNITTLPIQYIGRVGNVFSDISFAGFKWDSISNVKKLDCSFSEGYGVPYDKSVENKFLYSCKGVWDYDENLNPTPNIDGFNYENTHVNVIILAGQSNAEGSSDMTVLGSPYTDPIGQLEASYQLADLYRNLGMTTINSDNTGSVEIKAGLRLIEQGEKVLFIKVSYPGSAISTWQKGADNYTRFETVVNNAKSDLSRLGFTYTFREFWWIQGESDASNQALAENYSNNFQSMYNNMIADGLIPTGLNIRIPLLSNTPYIYESTINSQYQDIINNYQGSLIQTSTLTKHDDNVHYTAQGLLDLGDLFVDLYIGEGYEIVETVTKQLIPNYNDINSCDGNLLINSANIGFSDTGAVLDGLIIEGLGNGATFQNIINSESADISFLLSNNAISNLVINNKVVNGIKNTLDYSAAPTGDCLEKTKNFLGE